MHEIAAKSVEGAINDRNQIFDPHLGEKAGQRLRRLMEKVYRIGNDRKRLHSVLSMLANFLVRPEDDYELIFRKTVYKRSSDQNRRYWSLLNEIAEQLDVRGEKYAADTWHNYFRVRFIGQEEIKLPNGKTLDQPISTTTLDKGSFSEYMTQIEAFAAERGVLFSLDAIAA